VQARDLRFDDAGQHLILQRACLVAVERGHVARHTALGHPHDSVRPQAGPGLSTVRCPESRCRGQPLPAPAGTTTTVVSAHSAALSPNDARRDGSPQL
jgi:hypothetical protein